jgi:hypothetical protein
MKESLIRHDGTKITFATTWVVRTHRSYNQEFRKLGKPNNRIEYLLLPSEEIAPDDQLHRIIIPEKPLIPLLLTMRFAQDLIRIRIKLFIPCPCAVPDITFNKVPFASVVSRIVGLCITAVAALRTILVARPNDVIGIWMEPQNLCAERVRKCRCREGIPGPPSVSGIVESLGISDEVCSV